MPTSLDIFSGIGGFSLAFESAGFETLAFVEYHDTKRLILASHWPGLPIFGDIDRFDCREFLRAYGRPDVIAGGPPCQAASLLGTRMGTADERWKWPQAIRLVGELRPRFCVFENPPAVLSVESGRAFNGILSEMAALGYDGWWDVIPAAAFGAGHWRERLCIVFADATRIGERITTNESDAITGGRSAWDESASESDQRNGTLSPHDNNKGLQGYARNESGSERRKGEGRSIAAKNLPDLRGRVTGPDWWHEAQSGIPVLVSGLPARLVETASLCIGDSIVPQAFVPIAQAIYEKLKS